MTKPIERVSQILYDNKNELLTRQVKEIIDALNLISLANVTGVLRNVAIDYGIINSDYYIGVTHVGSGRNIALPVLTSVGIGKTVIVKDENGNVGGGTIVVNTPDDVKIDGANTYTIFRPYGSVTFIRNKDNWSIIGEYLGAI